MVKAVILLPCDASDEGKYIDFLNALVTIDYSWFSLYDHLVPWPRLMYLTPFFGPSPMVSGNFGAIVENGVRSIVTINQDLTLDEKFFTG